MVWFGLGIKTTWLGLGKDHFLSYLVLFTDTAGKSPSVSSKISGSVVTDTVEIS